MCNILPERCLRAVVNAREHCRCMRVHSADGRVHMPGRQLSTNDVRTPTLIGDGRGGHDPVHHQLRSITCRYHDNPFGHCPENGGHVGNTRKPVPVGATRQILCRPIIYVRDVKLIYSTIHSYTRVTIEIF